MQFIVFFIFLSVSNILLILCEDLPLCSNNQHVDGKWKYSDKVTKKSFRCCDGEIKDKMDLDECGTDDYHHGRYYNGSDIYYTQVGGRACNCDQRDGTVHILSEREKYEWVPNECRLLEWDAKDFCKLLGKRKILFVGASTMQQTSSTIMSMIKEHNGGCATQLYYITDFHFDTNRDGVQAWHIIAQRMKPDIVMLTAGAHVRGVDGIKKLFEMSNKLGGQLKEIKSLFGDSMTLIWRTNQAGHLNCGPDVKPNTPYKFEGVENTYHTELHLQYDKQAIEYAKKFGLKILDMSPTYLRPDSHPYVKPGKSLYTLLIY